MQLLLASSIANVKSNFWGVYNEAFRADPLKKNSVVVSTGHFPPTIPSFIAVTLWIVHNTYL